MALRSMPVTSPGYLSQVTSVVCEHVFAELVFNGIYGKVIEQLTC